MAEFAKKVKDVAKAALAAQAVAAIKKKYGRPAQEPEPDDGEKETAALVEKLDLADRGLGMAVTRFIARASKGGIRNQEIIRLTEAINQLAKGVK